MPLMISDVTRSTCHLESRVALEASAKNTQKIVIDFCNSQLVYKIEHESSSFVFSLRLHSICFHSLD